MAEENRRVPLWKQPELIVFALAVAMGGGAGYVNMQNDVKLNQKLSQDNATALKELSRLPDQLTWLQNSVTGSVEQLQDSIDSKNKKLIELMGQEQRIALLERKSLRDGVDSRMAGALARVGVLEEKQAQIWPRLRALNANVGYIKSAVERHQADKIDRDEPEKF